ncbi:MAG: hypothetical protein HDQ88_05020 [Clostridia bacterium]|nr:hypothetical protein [Clostridia bacterium]
MQLNISGTGDDCKMKFVDSKGNAYYQANVSDGDELEVRCNPTIRQPNTNLFLLLGTLQCYTLNNEECIMVNTLLSSSIMEIVGYMQSTYGYLDIAGHVPSDFDTSIILRFYGQNDTKVDVRLHFKYEYF